MSVPARSDYRRFYPVTTRWADNDIYGHVNNVVYYSWFDSAANRYLIEEGGLDIGDGSIVGYVVNFRLCLPRPGELPGIDRGGAAGGTNWANSSVQYGIAIFRAGEDRAVAHGHFVHVFVERAANRSVPIPPSPARGAGKAGLSPRALVPVGREPRIPPVPEGEHDGNTHGARRRADWHPPG